jgi:hypothetical protein
MDGFPVVWVVAPILTPVPGGVAAPGQPSAVDPAAFRYEITSREITA